MKRVIIESPYAGDVQTNIKYAQLCLKDSLQRGEAPFASHLLYTQVLDDTVKKERQLGISAGFKWFVKANLVAVYADLGISDGMNQGIDLATRLRIPIEYRKLRR